jgi:hypothetical protein
MLQDEVLENVVKISQLKEAMNNRTITYETTHGVKEVLMISPGNPVVLGRRGHSSLSRVRKFGRRYQSTANMNTQIREPRK